MPRFAAVGAPPSMDAGTNWALSRMGRHGCDADPPCTSTGLVSWRAGAVPMIMATGTSADTVVPRPPGEDGSRSTATCSMGASVVPSWSWSASMLDPGDTSSGRNMAALVPVLAPSRPMYMDAAD